MSKGSAFTRTVAYFRNAALEEATACLQVATEVVAGREPASDAPTKQRRKRRTKAQIAADAAHDGSDLTRGAGA